MIYSFHHFYEWLRGGVESGMAYRAKIFRSMGLDARFVFATTFPKDNIQQEMSRLGFLDSEVIWLYGFFTDCKIAPVTYTLEQLENSFGEEHYTYFRDGSNVRYIFPEKNRYYEVYLADDINDYVHRVCMISNGCLIRQDYYTYCRIYSEYYTPLGGQANLYMRRFFNEDGTVAYEEMLDGDQVLYRFPDRILFSREELVGYMMSCLRLTKDDVVIIDGEPGMIDRSAFILNSSPAKVGIVIHSNHYVATDEEHILWYGIYEYAFAHPEKIDFYVTNTETQSALLRKQFMKYKGIEPTIVSIPVSGIDKLRIPEKARRKHSLITAGRLMLGKRTDWVVEAVSIAKKTIPDLSLDIYGEGVEEPKVQKRIDELGCGEYVRLCGFQKLDEVYQNYDAYVSASCGETFGVTFLEAMGSGLPIVGFDLPYGAQIFIDDERNGYKIQCETVEELARGIVWLFTEADIEMFRQYSYKKAGAFLMKEVAKRWEETLGKIR